MPAIPEQRGDAEHVGQPLAHRGVVEQLAETAGQRQRDRPEAERRQRNLRCTRTWIDPACRAEKHAIRTHRLQYTCASCDRDVAVAKGGTGDAHRHDRGATWAEHVSQQIRCRRLAGGETGMTQSGQIGQVDQQIAKHHAGHAHAQRSRQGALRIAHFAGQVVEIMESAVGKQHRQQGADKCPRRHRVRGIRCQRDTQMPAGQHQPDHHQQSDGCQLQHGEDVLHPCAGADAEQVDAYDEGNRADSHGFHVDRRQPDRRAEVVGKRGRHRGYATGVIDQRHGPAEQERRQLSEGLSQIHVGAARLRPARAQFGVTQHTGQRQQTADGPQDQYLRTR